MLLMCHAVLFPTIYQQRDFGSLWQKQKENSGTRVPKKYLHSSWISHYSCMINIGSCSTPLGILWYKLLPKHVTNTFWAISVGGGCLCYSIIKSAGCRGVSIPQCCLITIKQNRRAFEQKWMCVDAPQMILVWGSLTCRNLVYFWHSRLSYSTANAACPTDMNHRPQIQYLNGLNVDWPTSGTSGPFQMDLRLHSSYLSWVKPKCRPKEAANAGHSWVKYFFVRFRWYS